MKSIRELAVQFNCNPIDINKVLVRHELFIVTPFGTDDGFISNDLFEHIQAEVSQVLDGSLDNEAIVNAKIDHIPLSARGSYVYFLLKNDLIVYVGQTICLTARVGEHLKSIKDFNYISFIEVPKRRLLQVESHYIQKLNPAYNLTGFNPVGLFESIVKSF